jgi:XTP/dITP diphosphohydrolase
MTLVVVATRSAHKLAELRQMLPSIESLEIVDLEAAGIPEAPEEEGIEAFFTFEENALAKARYFCSLSGNPVLSDDSGLCVDALGGAPGPLSKRFCRRSDLSGLPLDQANNDHLLRELADTPMRARGAHYVCVIALVTPEGEESIFRGSVDGTILMGSQGVGGFGYDPLFYVPDLQATFAQVPQAEKNRISHRARALQAAVPRLKELVDRASGRPLQDPPAR